MICKHCEKLFEGKAGHQRYCSAKCRVAAHRARGDVVTLGRAPALTLQDVPDADLIAEVERRGLRVRMDARPPPQPAAPQPATLPALFKRAGTSGEWLEVTAPSGQRMRVRVFIRHNGTQQREVEVYNTGKGYWHPIKAHAARELLARLEPAHAG